MEKIKLYTGTHHNHTVQMWGEMVTFDSEGVAEASEDIAKKAALGVPQDYSLTPTRRTVPKISASSTTNVLDANGVGKIATSVVEKRQKEKLIAQEKALAKEELEKDTTIEKTNKKVKKKSSSTAKAEETIPSSDQNPKEDESEGKKPKDIWK